MKKLTCLLVFLLLPEAYSISKKEIINEFRSKTNQEVKKIEAILAEEKIEILKKNLNELHHRYAEVVDGMNNEEVALYEKLLKYDELLKGQEFLEFRKKAITSLIQGKQIFKESEISRALGFDKKSLRMFLPLKSSLLSIFQTLSESFRKKYPSPENFAKQSVTFIYKSLTTSQRKEVVTIFTNEKISKINRIRNEYVSKFILKALEESR